MRQLTQKLGSGEMSVQEAPHPSCDSGMLLVRNHYSLISAGTEASSVRAARSNLFEKARQRPSQVRQVLDSVKRQGIAATYRAVTKKLDSYSPLGYSCAGEVIEVGEGVQEIARGDLVACAGAGYANHAEVVSVPTNLCVKLAPGANLKLAAYNTVGAIALQGIRQADIRLGETCAVIGLGLIGQLTCKLLRASGARVVGIDIDRWAVEFARRENGDFAWTRDEGGLPERIDQLTGGLGVDAVMITAATSSIDPVNFAGRIVRRKGRVVIVGDVPTGFEREAYYRKELDLRMSCSYGPGRYDPLYEEHGVDYPVAYVRWTEQRNMQAFQELVHTGQIEVGRLTTHEFPLEDAARAYDLILNRTERFLGILLRYDTARTIVRGPLHITASQAAGKIGLAFIGAGSYAQGNLLPNLPSPNSNTLRCTVVDAAGLTARRVAERFGFQTCSSDSRDALSDPAVNAVFIATRHDSHARYVLEALEAGKHVFVEKPLALTEEELASVESCYRGIARLGAPPALMVGFNRRFAPLAGIVKQKLGSGPMSMIYRINAGTIPGTDWTQDPAVGGGRIIGEVCHFIDFLTFLCGAVPIRVFASALPSPSHPADTVSITLEFADNSIGTICYYSNGSKAFDKEYVEAYSSGVTAILRDFRKLEIAGSGRTLRKSLLTQDKGQRAMVAAFLSGLANGRPAPISFEEISAVTRAAFAAVKSLAARQPVRFD